MRRRTVVFAISWFHRKAIKVHRVYDLFRLQGSSCHHFGSPTQVLRLSARVEAPDIKHINKTSTTPSCPRLTRMASLEGLPNETVISIIRKLCDNDRKIHHFDPVGVKDLQQIRLVSRRMSKLAAPLLFENMILDEKLLDEEDLARVSNFAEENPHLACHVRRLQRGLSPLFINAQHFRGEYTEQILRGSDATTLPGFENEVRLLDSLGEQLGFQTAFNKVQPCCHVSLPSRPLALSVVSPIGHSLVDRNTDQP